jgi:hypothetical protein
MKLEELTAASISQPGMKKRKCVKTTFIEFSLSFHYDVCCLQWILWSSGYAVSVHIHRNTITATCSPTDLHTISGTSQFNAASLLFSKVRKIHKFDLKQQLNIKYVLSSVAISIP